MNQSIKIKERKLKSNFEVFISALVCIMMYSTVLFSACNSAPAIPFSVKIDSVPVVYKDSANGPFLFTGLYQTTRTFIPVGDSNTTKGRWDVDTNWAMKIQVDTLKATNAVHTYRYQAVNKKYVQILKK